MFTKEQLKLICKTVKKSLKKTRSVEAYNRKLQFYKRLRKEAN